MSPTLPPACDVVLAALRRYEDHITRGSLSDAWNIHWNPLETRAAIEATETRLGVAIPPELTDIWTRIGTFDLPHRADWNSLSLFHSANATRPLALGLLDAIVWVWGDRPELEENLSDMDFHRINTTVFCFAIYTHDDNHHSYLCFDQHGTAAIHHFDQDDWDVFAESLAQAPTTKRAPEVIADSITTLLTATADELPDPDPTPLRLHPPHTAPWPTIEARPHAKTDPALPRALPPLLESSDATAVFTLLRDWPTKDETWLGFARSRITAPSCTDDQRTTLRQLIAENS
ncbi:hypothetical protein [Nocardia lasii]|uniref:Knr4/Smi1-like domain-containing protein n=1 Tax=Nocardia lasii TaxID=1616107 RepID=A0ABW1JP53_9NOCA